MLTGHMPSPNLIVIIHATELSSQRLDTKEPNYLLQFSGFVFEKVTASEPR